MIQIQIDEKVTVWQRTIVEVDETFLQKSIEENKINDFINEVVPFQNGTMLHDTVEYIRPNENNGCATVEIFLCENQKELYNNAEQD